MKKTLALILGTLALSNSVFAASKAELHITATVVHKCEFINGKVICGNDLVRQIQAQQQMQFPSSMFVEMEERKDSEVLFNESTITLEDIDSGIILKSYEF